MATRGESIVRRVLEEYWNGKTNEDLAVALLDELFSPDYVEEDPATPGALLGRAGLWQKRALFLEAFPDLRSRAEALLASGEYVVARWVATGTHRGEIFGIPASGRFVTVAGISIYRLDHDRISSHGVNWDGLGLARQLGAPSHPLWPESQPHLEATHER
jgi:steroid delta-isomerase-like uncharacterized protein